MGMRVVGHTCARTVVLAVEEGPPSPAARPGPIHGMGRRVRCRAHPLTGSAGATLNAVDKIAQPAAHVLPTACASGRSRTSSRSRSRRYADHTPAQSQSSARSPSWFDGDVRTGAAGRVTPTFLSTSFTTTRARSTWTPDHDGHLHPRTSVTLLVAARK